jgi:hypothetical protein
MGVNEDAPINASAIGAANWPLGQAEDRSVGIIKLKDVLTGDEIKGPGLISVGRLNAAGYSFLFVGDMVGWMFDSDISFSRDVVLLRLEHPR